ncbi:multi-sensor hybrid histidine kinase [Chthoniobacter flavus Ellin428]|uniref:histidine kinase n=2 Tax=Chthoniobacter flavus TaxID=191863 RepID=B4D3J9_9BACT|nr:multi-sensor hybrid histidine kinase [Chthoniobacter flavus Ellin428]TCO93427.1 PAS domain S-box-containing protein [Chthoniobacter flavus]
MQLPTETPPMSGKLKLPEYFFQLLVEASADALLVVDEQGAIVFANAQAGRVFGYRPDDLLHKPIQLLIPDNLHAQHARHQEHSAKNSRARHGGGELDLRGRRSDGSEFVMDVGLSPLETHRGSLVIVSVRDLSEQKRVERRERDRLRVLELLNSGAPLQEILEFTVRAVEAEIPGAICSILLLDDSGKRLVHGAAPNLPEFFNDAVHGVEIGDGVGSCGTAAYLGKLTIVEDIHTHPFWAKYVDLAKKAKVRACWSQPVFSSDKKVLGTFAIYHREPSAPEARDIEAIEAAASYVSLAITRKRSEEELQASEARLHAIIHNTPNVAVELYDMAGRVRFWNEAATRMFGWEIDEAIGKTLDQLIHTPEEAESFLQLLRELSGTGKSLGPLEYHFRRRDGSEGWSISTIFEIPGFGGVPMFVCMDVDITERKQAENAMRQSEERFRQVVENIQEVFWMLDAKDGRLLYISPGYEKIWGRSSEALYRSPAAWFDAIHSDDRERVPNRSTLNHGADQYDEEYRIIRPDGSVRWIHDRAFPIRDNQGHVYRVAGVAEDITERRQIEERLRQSQKMEAIGQLAGGVAHDFNNILAAVMMEVELAATAKDVPADTREGLQVIGAAADKAAALTRQLLLFSRRQVMQPRRVDVNGIVTTLAKMLQRILGEDVKVQLHLHPSALVVHADPGMLDQVIMNLAVNARDAMPAGGRLVIETSERHITEDELRASPDASSGMHVVLAVSDTGMGMTEDVKAHLFEPFFTTKQPGKGTGLGLATIFGIVKQHRGWIRVYSEIGQGTTFRIFLPACEAGHELPSEAAAAARPRGGHETILLVEDEASVREVSKRMLERHGYKVLEAVSGTEALRVWGEHGDKIQLVFTDIVMPGGIGGRELADQLRMIQPNLKIVFTSGYSSELAGGAIRLQEGINFVQKPSSLNEVLDTIRKCLDEPF